MTELYTILAVLLLGGLMTGVYLVGFGDGVTAEKLRRAHEKESMQRGEEDGGDRHAITHADLAQMEQEAKNKQEDEWRKQI